MRPGRHGAVQAGRSARVRPGTGRGAGQVAESERGPGLGAAASWSREGSRRVLSQGEFRSAK